MPALKVTYILSAYPGLHTTFVDREVTILRDMGVDLRVLAYERPEGLLSENQKELQKTVVYLKPSSRAAAALAHLRFALTRPLRYLGALAYLLTRKHSSQRARLKTLGQFSLGVQAADRLRKSPPDHIHAHFVHAVIVALVISRLLKIPYSVTAHASRDIFVKPVMLREKLSEAKFVATCTRYNFDYLKQFGKGVFDDKVKCVYHGLDVQRYRRKRTADSAARPVILGVGQLKERKGFHLLIDACAALQDQGLDFECRLIGDGPMRSEMEAQVRRLGLADRVRLYGALPQETVIEHYEQAALFALPALTAQDGDRDGIPNVILEAMAMELPVVSTDHSAIPEIIADGVNGLLVPAGDCAALVEALARLLLDPELRRRLGSSGRQTVMEKFDPRKNARVLLDEMEK